MRRDAELPNVSVLKIDKDCFVDNEWVRDFVRLTLFVCQWYGITVISIGMTETRKGLHFYIHITPAVQPELANRLQFLMGDDARRVDFNRARIRSGLNEWNLLFERASVKLRMIHHASRFWPEQHQLKRGESNGQRISGI
jgi:hypothetical protein